MAVSSGLGVEYEVELSTGRLRYRERGQGPPVVFVHGLLANADLWRSVVPGVAAAGLRCVAPDWPLGAHELAVPGMDLSPPGMATVIAEFLERLDLHEVTLVANDTGGALTQILMARSPERVARVVLTPSDSLERFFPPMFALLPALARVPGGLWLMTRAVRLPWVAQAPIGFGWLTKRGLPAMVLRSFLTSSCRSPAVRADMGRFLRGVDKRHTLAAAEGLHRFDRPVLLAWAIEDRLFPIALAHRLAERLPQARIIGISDAYTFVPEDQPEALTRLIVEFVGAPAASQPG
jgi:pimeloyl-ACP methyl ester carboxylesterase